jgi:hypothetical protein
MAQRAFVIGGRCRWLRTIAQSRPGGVPSAHGVQEERDEQRVGNVPSMNPQKPLDMTAAY